MLGFLRQIRQRLIADNRFSKYLLYAVGEIVLIVLGIWIALQLNNWNEDRQKDERIKLQLINLLRDFEGDKENLNFVRGFHAFRVHAAYYLLDQYGITENISPLPEAGELPRLDQDGLYAGPIPDSTDISFISRGFSWLLRKYPSKPNSDAIDEFKSTGLYALFDNQQLKNNIREYYAYYSFILPLEVPGDSHPTTQLKNEFVSNGYSYLDVPMLEDPVQELLSYPSHVALLKNIIDESTYRSNESSRLIDILDDLIQQTRIEIDKYSNY